MRIEIKVLPDGSVVYRWRCDACRAGVWQRDRATVKENAALYRRSVHAAPNEVA